MSNFNEESMRTELFLVLDDLKASLDKETPGTEKHSAIIRSIKDISSIIHEDYKIANTIERDQEEADLKEREFKANVLKAEREANFKEDQAMRTCKWYNEPIVQTLITTGAAVGLSGVVVWMNLLTENPLKSGASPTLMKAIGWLKK